MYGWRGRIGHISPTACVEIFPYEFYRAAPEGVTVVIANLVIRDARESAEVEASWAKFDTAIEDLKQTHVDHFTLSGAPLVLAKGVDRHRELLKHLRERAGVPVSTSPRSFADGLKHLGASEDCRSDFVYPGAQRTGQSIFAIRRFRRFRHREFGHRHDLDRESDALAESGFSPREKRRAQVSQCRRGADNLVSLADADGYSSFGR